MGDEDMTDQTLGGHSHTPGSEVPPPVTQASEVEAVILGLAAQEATGCLTIANSEGDEGLVWYRDGQVYAVSVPGRRPLLGVRLITAGAISAEQLNSALELQRSSMTSARLGEVLVHLNLVNRRVIEAFALEQQRDMLADLLGWHIASHWFRNGAHTRTDLAPFLDVARLIQEARVRQQQWPVIVDEIGGVDVVPLPTDHDPQAALSTSEVVVLKLVDGIRTLTDIADDCGYTVYEAADVLLGLVAAGLVTTAADLLHDPRPALSGYAEADESDVEQADVHLAAVLELHPHTEVVAASGDVERISVSDAKSFDNGPSDVEPEPLPILNEVTPGLAATNPPLAPPVLPSFEPAITADASSYQQLPPPSAAPVGQPLLFPGEIDPSPTAPAPTAHTVPTVPTAPSEPADTAALLRELTSLGFDQA